MAGPIALATCLAWPELSPSDTYLARALRARGHEVTAAPWNGDFAPFRDARAVVVRSTWDFHEAPDSYRDWIGRLDALRTFNTPDLIRWNLAKTHVLDLAGRGVRVPRTVEVAAEPAAIAAALDTLGLDDGVIKPLVGASGFGVERVRRGDERAALERAQAHKTMDRVLVQEFVSGIELGEAAGVFFDGTFSHALRRVAAPGEFRINAQYGGRMDVMALAPEIIDQMCQVLAVLPGSALYARIDGVVQGSRFVLMEVEVNEPGLGLDLVPDAADRFADALLRHL
jgi:glutathione synthase/RimK-type ligase-like ATP-grasp enzyme